MIHPATAHPSVAPIGLWDRLAIVVLGLAGCALSYDALQQMAVAIHIRGHLTYLFPLVIDGFIAYGVRALLVLSQAPLRARLYVWVLFATATAASIWANALHALRLNQQTTHPGLRLSDTVVAILSTLAPLALAGAVHLYILITRHHPGGAPQADQPETRPTRHIRTTQRFKSTRRRGAAGLNPRTTDHSSAAPDQQASPADASHGEHGPARGSAPHRADHSSTAVRSPSRTTDHRGVRARADQRTNTTPDRRARGADQNADRGLPAADQQFADGPHEARSGRCTSNDAGPASGPHGPADHERAGHAHGPAEEPAPVSADQGAPADRMPDREYPQTADHDHRTADQPTDAAPADQRTNTAPDHPDRGVDQVTDQPADQDEDGSPGGPQGARSHGAPAADQRTKPTDQDEAPWEAKVAVARQAALAEGRMTRRAIRPHLRNANISVSNELFSDLQAALYADPALAHLPRDTRRTR
ncbi:DUF2637 domain-containing protein [Streptomyces silvensis]|uniref:DUF2637 domain-containing protein n=1 Tax=Streptomyces silvensis TaxID=1765722 RepID=A0A0W7X3G8_9ACTN|nr:DUF2637 domain-containing protein [Streptomyces silvensis]KUF17320.1 hypothetical protein AT728_16040 [Streptomyces silvensis]